MNIDLSNRDCMKAVTNIGETVYMNICDGTQAVVPWGTTDWITVSLAAGFMAFITLGFCVMGYQMFRLRRYM